MEFKFVKPLRIYEIDVSYCKYLCTFDSHIHKPIGENYKGHGRYIGVVHENNGVQYFAPLTSDKNMMFVNLDSQNNTIEKIMSPGTLEHPSRYLGSIRIANQIPVSDKTLSSSINPYVLKERNLQNLLIIQLQSINKYRSDVINKAQNCLGNKITYEEKQHISNFKLLEGAAKIYDKNNKLIQERIQAYPKTFSNSENEEFFKKIENKELPKNNQSGGQGGTPFLV